MPLLRVEVDALDIIRTPGHHGGVMRFYRWDVTVFVATMAVGAACEAGLGPEERSGESLQTDRLSYTSRYVEGQGTYQRYGFEVIVRFTNRTDGTLYLGRCYPDTPTPIYGVIPADTPTGVESAYNGVWACGGHDKDFAVPAGALRVDTLQLSGPNARDGRSGQPFGQLEGRFRIVYDVRTCPGDSYCPADRSLSVSNAFDVQIR